MAISSYYRGLREKLGSELLLIPAVAAVVRDQYGRVLIQQSHHGIRSLPAGAIEPGEAPAQAVAREVHEETGLRVRAERILAVVGGADCRTTYPSGDRVEYVVTVFECKTVSGALIERNDETARLQWFALDRLPPLHFPYPEHALRADSRSAYFAWDEEWLRTAE